METPTPQTPGAAGGTDTETPTQRQARLRRERREAKLRDQGTSRLEKITKVSGRQHLPDQPPTNPSTPGSAAKQANNDSPSVPSNAAAAGGGYPPGMPSEADLRALLRAAGPPAHGDDTQPGFGAGGEEEDPMMKMLSMLMGGMGGNGGAPGENGAADMPPGLPPGLAAMLGGMAPPPSSSQQTPQQQQQQKGATTYAYIWKIVHALFALMLGLYATSTSTAYSDNRSLERYTLKPGTAGIGKSGRNKKETLAAAATSTSDGVMNLFLVFASAELILQSSRFFLSRRSTGGQKGSSGGLLGGGGGGGWMGMLTGILPEPYRGYLLLVMQYVQIAGTVAQDALVVVFVVGCAAWWHGAMG